MTLGSNLELLWLVPWWHRSPHKRLDLLLLGLPAALVLFCHSLPGVDKGENTGGQTVLGVQDERLIFCSDVDSLSLFL